MIQRYDGKQALKMRMALVADDVYCIVSDALKKLYPEKTPLNSVEIWMAAHGFTCDLMNSPAPEEIFEDLVEELREEVASFKFQDCPSGESAHARENSNKLGSPLAQSQTSSSKNSVFLILMVSMCQISGLREKITNAKPLVERLIAFCRQNEMFFPLLEKFDGKEMSRRAVGKKIDLLNYEMKAVGDNNEERRKLLDAYVEAVVKLGPQNIESNLLVLNKLNLQNGHIYDDVILGMYEQLEQKFVPKPGIEVTMGNKNVAESGSNQLNTGMPQSLAGYQEILKLLGNGGR